MIADETHEEAIARLIAATASSPAEILSAAAETFREKSKEYGGNYLKIGSVLQALFPDGLKMAHQDDHNRYHLFLMMLVKLTRYAENFNKGGHQDSLRDLAVYAAMLEAMDHETTD